MEFYDVVRKRRSIRKYKKEGKIEKSVIERIAEAGAAAPSARSVHPWKFAAVTEADRIQELAGIIGNNGKFIAGASAAIIVICEDTKYYIEDGCGAVENMLLAITAEGLGACWIA
ncbi:MAG: nitroreductase family protein, partial [Candidatus Goldiibacteriota bacterium]